MLLHDKALRASIATDQLSIDPFDDSRIQPSSIDLTLDREFGVMLPSNQVIDVKCDNSDRWNFITVPKAGCFDILPGEFVLAATREVVGLGDSIAGRIEGKSSLGRLGLMVHSTAGFIDPGFTGQITLELSNMANAPIRLYPYMPIAQLAVFRMAGRVGRPYGLTGHYNGQSGATPSRYHLNFSADSQA